MALGLALLGVVAVVGLWLTLTVWGIRREGRQWFP